MNKNLLLIIGFSLSLTTVFAQQKIKDGTVSGSALPNKDALLELESSNKGLLTARVALRLTTDFYPLTAHIAGMMVYNTASVGDVTPGIYFNDGSKWVKAQTGAVNLTNGSNTTVTGTGTVADPFKINTGKSTISQNVTTGVITHTNEAGDVKTANLVSANSGNLLTIGTDGGVILNSAVLPVTTSDNGLTKLGSNTQLGGELIKATNIVTDATKTLAIRGLQNGLRTDNALVADANGVLRLLSTSSLASEPWNVQGTTNSATLNTEDIYQTGNVAVGTSTANSSFQVAGSISTSVRVTTTDDVLSSTDFTLISRATSAITITLPDPTTCKGRVYIIVNNGSASITTSRPFEVSVGQNQNFVPKAGVGIGAIFPNFGNKYTIQSDGTSWVLLSLG